MSKPAKGEMTIQELARRTGMTVRNIRAHQTRGLLPPPVVRGRTGYYNEDHVARIKLTREMQADGLNLEAIRRVLEGGDASAVEIFDFTRTLRASFGDEAAEIFSGEELTNLWEEKLEEETERELTRRAEEIGIMRTLPGGQFEIISPRMFGAAVALAEFGVRREAAIATAEKLRRQADDITHTFVDLFVKEIWQPFEDAGRPKSEWPKVRHALERLQPLASEALLGVFQIAMVDAVEAAGEETLRNAAGAEPEKPAGEPRGKSARSRD